MSEDSDSEGNETIEIRTKINLSENYQENEIEP